MIVEPLPQCPHCNVELVDQRADNGGILFSCDSCGWQRLERYPFNVGSWHVTIRQALAPFDILQSLLTDTAIVPFLRPRLKGISHLSQPMPNFELSDSYYKGEIEIANKVYLSQMIVLVITYSELIVKDFHRCLFIAQPQRMNPFLSQDGKGKATVELNELLQASSKQALIEALAERAADRAVGLRLDKTVEKIMRDCKLKIKLPLIDDLRMLIDQRNRIVHEGELGVVTPQQVIASFGQSIYMLYLLGEAAIKHGVVTIDETNLIQDRRST